MTRNDVKLLKDMGSDIFTVAFGTERGSVVVQGETNKAISEKLCLSPKTTSTYRYRLFDKLGVDNDVELTRFAIRHGLIKENVSH